MSYFKNIKANIYKNDLLRVPQIDGHLELYNYFENQETNESAIVVLPTGVGKTTLMAIAPFNISNGKVLIIAPQLTIRNGIVNALRRNNPENVYYKYRILPEGAPYPKILNYNTTFNKNVNKDLLDQADIVILNIHKLQDRLDTSLVNLLPKDYFDMIIIDEAHHAEAITWKSTLDYFNNAKVIKVTATPFRTDNVKPEGKVIYDYKLSEAMVNNYVKSLQRIDYVPDELYLTVDGVENEVFTVEEIYKKGIKDEDWVSRSVALSSDCNMSIVKSSIEIWRDLIHDSDVPHKIIAVACSIEHAEQIADLYRSYGLRVGIVHSYMETGAKEIFFTKLEQHRYDVVVNVTMLGEGFDHKYLTIGAIFRPFRNLLPYQQFVGRLLRRIPNDEATVPEDNIARIVSHHYMHLDKLWLEYQKSLEEAELIRGLYNVVRLSDYDRGITEPNPADIGEAYQIGDGMITEHDFLNTKLTEEAKKRQEKRLESIKAVVAALNVDFETAEKIYEATNKPTEETLDEMFASTKERLNKQIQYEIPLQVCDELGLDPKGSELLHSDLMDGTTGFIVGKSKGRICTNDAIIAIYLNCYFKDYVGYNRNSWNEKSYYLATEKLQDRKDYIIDLLKR